MADIQEQKEVAAKREALIRALEKLPDASVEAIYLRVMPALELYLTGQKMRAEAS